MDNSGDKVKNEAGQRNRYPGQPSVERGEAAFFLLVVMFLREQNKQRKMAILSGWEMGEDLSSTMISVLRPCLRGTRFCTTCVTREEGT